MIVSLLEFLRDLHAYDLAVALHEELGNLLMRSVILGDFSVGPLRQINNFRPLGCIGATIFLEVGR